MICAAALPPPTPYSHTTSKVLAAAASAAALAAAGAFAAAADFSDGNLGPDFSAAGREVRQADAERGVAEQVQHGPELPLGLG